MMIFLLFFLTAIATSVVSGVALGFVCQGIAFYTAALSLVLGLITSSIIVHRTRSHFLKNKSSLALQPAPFFWEYLVIAVFIFASVHEFTRLIVHQGDLLTVPHTDEGDLALHITFIHYLAAVRHWWPANPLLIGVPLRYYIGMDFFNSLLLLVGIPLEQGLIWVGLLGAALTGIALWRWGRAFAMAALLFNGGLGALFLFQKINPHVDPESLLQWRNIFLTSFISQRGYLYAFPAGLLLMSIWREAYFDAAQKRKNIVPLAVQVLLLGAMPLFHAYAFLFLSAIMVSLMVFSTSARKGLWPLAALAWPIGGLFIIMISRGGVSTIGWHLGWMQEGNPVWFWLSNFGISLPLALWLVIKLFFKSPSTSLETIEARAFVWPAAAVFIFCLIVRVAPWPWDNTKLMIWSWLTIAPFLWRDLIAPRAAWLRAVLCFLLFASGAITLFSSLAKKNLHEFYASRSFTSFSWDDYQHNGALAKESELAETTALLKNFSPEDVIAIAPQCNHPVLLLGHPVAVSFPGHVWSHGLPFEKKIARLQSIMNGEEHWEENAKDLGVSAIYWGIREREAFPHSKLPFAHQQEGALLYKIHKNEKDSQG